MPTPKGIPTTRTPNICADFSGNMGDPVDWQGAPVGCIISKNGTNTFPFTPYQTVNGKPQITMPPMNQVKIASGLTANTTYSYNVSCCTPGSATHTVKVDG